MAQAGFINTRFLANLQPGKFYRDVDDFYTHFPPFCDILNALLRRSGVKSLFGFRFPAVVLAALAVLFWFFFIRKVYNSKVAFFSTLFLAILPEFYKGSFSPSIFAFDQFYRFAAIYLTVLLFDNRSENSGTTFFFLWLVLFFQSITSFQYIVYSQLFIWGYAFLFKVSGEDKKKALRLFSAPVIGVFLHLLQNIWLLGFSNLMTDLSGILAVRTGMHTGAYLLKMLKAVKIFIWFFMDIYHLADYGIALLFIVIVVLSLLELKKSRELSVFSRYLAIFLVCDISWFILFPQHSIEHQDIIKSLLPSTTFLMGILFYINIERLSRLINSPQKIQLTKHAIITILLLLIYGAKMSMLASSVDGHLSRPPLEYHYRDLKKFLPEDAICLTNIGRDVCLISYYLDRRTYYCKESFYRRNIFIQTPTGKTCYLKELENKPFFDKDKLFYVYYREKRNKKREKQFLKANAQIVATFKDVTIYKIL